MSVLKKYFKCKLLKQVCPGKQVSCSENPTMLGLSHSVYKESTGTGQ